MFLNRLVDPVSSLVVSAGSVEMKKTDELQRMLRTSTLPPSLERIPVRHLGYSSFPMPYYYPYMPPSTFGPGKMHEEYFFENMEGEKMMEPGGENPNRAPEAALEELIPPESAGS